ncbi:MAG: hypothetical protein H0V55_01370 [Thermoleophilaceae bacterium]|jgi:polyhydroxyalkanoate synthesis regulator phasin|nr:hypothetical protein [Thermoleophilaceae bacterium]
MAQGGSGSGGGTSGGKRSSSGGSKGGTSRSSGSSSAKRSGGSRSGGSSSAKRSGGSSRSSAQRSEAARKGGQARARQQQARKRADEVASAGAAPAEAADFSGKTVADLRSAIRRSIIAPLNMVMITRDRIEEVLDDAVKRGRMTADDAQSVVKGLVARGRQQTDDVLSNLESLLGRTRDEVESRADDARQVGTDAAGRAVKGVTSTAKTARKTADPVLVQADRARRVAGVGPSFPITGYHELTAAEVQSRLDTLSRAELRKVRDHERRNANRKTVLEAIETKLT